MSTNLKLNPITGELDLTSDTSKPTANSYFIEDGNDLKLYYKDILVHTWTVFTNATPIGLLLALTRE